MKLYAGKPFKLYDFGPAFPLTMKVLINLTGLILYLRLFRRAAQVGWAFESLCVLILYVPVWWTYVRIEKELAGNKRGIVLLSGMMVLILLMATMSFHLA